MEELALQIIESLPVTLRRLTADLSDARLRRRPASGGWSIVEITGHLIDKTEVWGERFRHIATQNQPSLPAFDQDAWVRDRNYQ
ncbi:MAG TPA: DinB family protein, partial [Dehalococcoidia bacterium]|nr:DinB family protein [Dehalococcoidia bacterium]